MTTENAKRNHRERKIKDEELKKLNFKKQKVKASTLLTL